MRRQNTSPAPNSAPIAIPAFTSGNNVVVAIDQSIVPAGTQVNFLNQDQQPIGYTTVGDNPVVITIPTSLGGNLFITAGGFEALFEHVAIFRSGFSQSVNTNTQPNNHMKNSAYKLTLALALLSAFLAPITSFARTKHMPDQHKSGIIGQVVQLPGPWHIRIDTLENQFVEDIQANDDGSFDVDLKPGTYLLTPFFPAVGSDTAELVGVTATVTVNKKRFTTVELFIVHGPE